MTSNWKEFILKTGYAVAGVIVAGLVSFLTQNPVILGGSTAVVVGILSVIEQTLEKTTAQ